MKHYTKMFTIGFTIGIILLFGVSTVLACFKPPEVPACVSECDEVTPTPTQEPEVTPTEEPEVTPTVEPTKEPEQPVIIPTSQPEPCRENCNPQVQGSTTGSECTIKDIGDVANINVKGTGKKGELEVQWSLPANADKVHIEFGLGKKAEHALLNTPNDGNEIIRDLKSGQHYWFRVMGVRECGVGKPSNWFDPIVL